MYYCENDSFPISDIKDWENMHLIHRVFLTIINMSIAQAVFPQSEKLACIKPTYKGKGYQNDLNSYRPISNLSYLSKLIETTIEKQLWPHLKDVIICYTWKSISLHGKSLHGDNGVFNNE